MAHIYENNLVYIKQLAEQIKWFNQAKEKVNWDTSFEKLKFYKQNIIDIL